jgi:hypothetical protein
LGATITTSRSRDPLAARAPYLIHGALIVSLECLQDVGIELRFALRTAGTQDMVAVRNRKAQLPIVVVAARRDASVVELLERR